MFELDKIQAKITSFNPRAEKHNEENVPAGDIHVRIAHEIKRARHALRDQVDEVDLKLMGVV